MSTLNAILTWVYISRLRRNHALEHATLQVLAQRGSHRTFAGYSDWKGFWVVGEIGTEELLQAAIDALARLKNGEHNLAIHPACGTNFAVAGAAAGTAAWLVMLNTPKGFRRKLERWSLVMSVVTLVFMLVYPMGPRLQARFTTQPDVGNLQIRGVTLSTNSRVVVHRVLTKA